MSRANFAIVTDDFLREDPLVIKDVGPWDKYPSVTNDAENVVFELVRRGLLPEGRLLFYYDSDGRLDEILVKNGQFVGFAPGPREGKL